MKLIQLDKQALDGQLSAEISNLFISTFNHVTRAVKTNDLLKQLSVKCLPQTFRDILGEIRRNGVLKKGFIVSDVQLGYWYTEDQQELNDFLQRQLNRIANQYANIQYLHNSLKSKRSNSETVKQLMFDIDTKPKNP